MDEGVALLVVGAVLGVSVLLALGTARTGVPVLVAFLALGMLLGSDGPGGIEFDDAELARQVGIVGLVLILFEGGLQTSWRRLRSVAAPAALLSTVGVLVTALLTGVAARMLFDLRGSRRFAGCCRRVDRCGCGVRDASLHAHQAPRRAHARGRVGRQRPDGDRPHSRADRVDREPRHARPVGARRARRPPARARAPVGVALAVAATWLFARLPASIGPFALVASLAVAAVLLRSCGRDRGQRFLSGSPVGLAIGAPVPIPPAARRFPEGFAFLAQGRRFIVLGLLVFPRELRTSLAPALRWRYSSPSSSAPLPSGCPRRSTTSAGANASCWAGPGCEAQCRSCSRCSSSPRTSTARTRSSTPSSSSSSSRSSCKERRSSASQGDSTFFHRLARPTSHRSTLVSSSPLDLLDFAVAPDHAIAGAAVREVAASCEPRSSPSSFGATARSHLGGARSSSRATASSSSSRIRCAPPSKTSSLAGSGGFREA